MLLERMICSGCKVPMKCTDTSVPVVYNEAVVYHGTEFTCPECGAGSVPITSSESLDAYDFTKPKNTIEVSD